MRKLVLTLLGLIALFAALRAYPQAVPVPSAGIQLHPGLVEVQDGTASVGVAFGVVENQGGQSGLWSLLPLRVVYRNGDTTLSLGLNGLSFLLRGGVTVGRPVRVTVARAGDVISIGGKISVDSRVQGDVWALGADVDLGPGAEVGGNVVAIGGKVTAAAKSVVHGSVSQLPTLKIPFLGVLGTEWSVQVLSLGRQALGYLLLGAALLLSSFYLTPHGRGLYQSFPVTWRETLVTLALSLVIVPLLFVLLIVSVLGVFFLPIVVFVLVLAALDGFLLLCARVGGMLRRASVQGGAGDSLFLFTSGLLGLFLVKLPALVGIMLTLLRSDAATQAGQVLQLITLGLTAAGMLYGFGGSLAHVRARAAH